MRPASGEGFLESNQTRNDFGASRLLPALLARWYAGENNTEQVRLATARLSLSIRRGVGGSTEPDCRGGKFDF
jgi:hypothetical protein